jgi:hypothetical protein
VLNLPKDDAKGHSAVAAFAILFSVLGELAPLYSPSFQLRPTYLPLSPPPPVPPRSLCFLFVTSSPTQPAGNASCPSIHFIYCARALSLSGTEDQPRHTTATTYTSSRIKSEFWRPPGAEAQSPPPCFINHPPAKVGANISCCTTARLCILTDLIPPALRIICMVALSVTFRFSFGVSHLFLQRQIKLLRRCIIERTWASPIAQATTT